MFILFQIGLERIFKFKGNTLKSLLIIIPGIIVAINNFPISAYLNGRAAILEPQYTIYLFLAESLSTGFFEEVIFRGLILLFIIQKLEKSGKGIFYSVVISSAIFALIHILNLFVGAGFGATMLQVGYSFLMGLMWAVFFLKTKNIWFVVVLHGLYNFFGQVMFVVGVVENRYDTFTIVFTSLLGIIVAVYTVYILLSIKPDDLKNMYQSEKQFSEVE